MFQSVFDYPYLSSSANHVLDLTVGYAPDSALSGATNVQNAKKINIYNQMAQVLMGHSVSGTILRFSRDGKVIGGSVNMKECIFMNFSRLLAKDEIKKGSFTLKLGVNPHYDKPFRNSIIKVQDTNAENDYRVNSPAGEYGILYMTNDVGTQGHDDSDNDNDCTPSEDLCGNGQVDPGETCDGDCPQSVADCPLTPAACTSSTYTGSAQMCTAQCAISATVACIDDDACCPMGCDSTTDNDCQPPAPICGDGMVEGNELCDGDCPSTVSDCNDADACTTEMLTGSDCQSECVYQPVTSCDADGCCNGTCLNDPDCAETDLCGQPVSQNTNEPASVIATFAIEDQSCCFDYTGDNQPDNSLGQLLQIAGARQSTNTALQQSIDSGAQAIVLEHDGINGIANTASYTINVLDGAPQCFQTPDAQGGNFYTINPSSYDSAGQPLATLPMANSTGGLITTGQGNLILIVDFVGAGLVLPIRLAQLQATLAPNRSSLPDKGIALDSGTIGGIVKLTEMYDAINDFAATSCTCYTNSNPNNPDLIIYSSASNASCNSGISANACGNSGVDGACRDLRDTFCGQIGLIPFFADVNSNNPGTNCGNSCDSLSVGASFTAHGARIK